MAKTKKIKQCYRSASGSRRPRCNQASVDMCSPCSEAMAYYNHANAIRQAARRQSNRNSARLSRMKKEENFSNLLSDNLGLTLEHDELTKNLDDINAENQAWTEAIHAKIQEIFAILLAEPTQENFD